MGHRLASSPEIEVVDTIDQDTAAAQPLSAWESIDAVLVDVCDDRALGEVGTDVYSGISVVERVYRIRNLRCIAITPVCANPLVRLRLQHARPDYSYHRFELNSLDALLEAVMDAIAANRNLLRLAFLALIAAFFLRTFS